jgi:ABC-type phosphate transport system auxiliary subunit
MEVMATIGILASFGVYLVERLLASKRVESRLEGEFLKRIEAEKKETKAELAQLSERIENIQTRMNKLELRR